MLFTIGLLLLLPCIVLVSCYMGCNSLIIALLFIPLFICGQFYYSVVNQLVKWFIFQLFLKVCFICMFFGK